MCWFLRIYVGVCKGVHVIGDTREMKLVSRVQLSTHPSRLEPVNPRPSRRMYDDLPTHKHTDAHFHVN